MLHGLFQHQQPERHILLRQVELIGPVLHLFIIVQEQQYQHVLHQQLCHRMLTIGVAELTTIISHPDNCANPRLAKRGFLRSSISNATVYSVM